MRNRFLAVALGVAVLLAIGVVAFVAQQRSTETSRPRGYAVVAVADVTMTPLPVAVVMQRGADRMQQRTGSTLGPCAAGIMGCASATEPAPVTVFLVRDASGQLHAFIGEDPRNGCALEWLPERPELQQRAVFHDTCHGSVYDRQGHVVGGPSPWNLNELATETGDGKVYVDPQRILSGACPGCPR